jgi:hypothetical protein
MISSQIHGRRGFPPPVAMVVSPGLKELSGTQARLLHCLSPATVSGSGLGAVVADVSQLRVSAGRGWLEVA